MPGRRPSPRPPGSWPRSVPRRRRPRSVDWRRSSRRLRLPSGLGASRRQRPRLSASGPRQSVPAERAHELAELQEQLADDASAARRMAEATASAIDLRDAVTTTDVRVGGVGSRRGPRAEPSHGVTAWVDAPVSPSVLRRGTSGDGVPGPGPRWPGPVPSGTGRSGSGRRGPPGPVAGRPARHPLAAASLGGLRSSGSTATLVHHPGPGGIGHRSTAGAPQRSRSPGSGSTRGQDCAVQPDRAGPSRRGRPCSARPGLARECAHCPGRRRSSSWLRSAGCLSGRGGPGR